MSAMNKLWNKVDRFTGRSRERFGHATGNPRMRDEGRADQMRARFRMTGERLKDAIRGR